MDELERIRQRKLREMMRKDVDESEHHWPTEPVVLSDGTFEQVVRKYPLVVVDCWAEWCVPCRMVAPIVEELARDYHGRIVFGKLNVDSNPGTAQQYEIMGIPTLLVFRNGQLVNQIVGALPRSELETKITQYL